MICGGNVFYSKIVSWYISDKNVPLEFTLKIEISITKKCESILDRKIKRMNLVDSLQSYERLKLTIKSWPKYAGSRTVNSAFSMLNFKRL